MRLEAASSTARSGRPRRCRPGSGPRPPRPPVSGEHDGADDEGEMVHGSFPRAIRHRRRVCRRRYAGDSNRENRSAGNRPRGHGSLSPGRPRSGFEAPALERSRSARPAQSAGLDRGRSWIGPGSERHRTGSSMMQRRRRWRRLGDRRGARPGSRPGLGPVRPARYLEGPRRAAAGPARHRGGRLDAAHRRLTGLAARPGALDGAADYWLGVCEALGRPPRRRAPRLRPGARGLSLRAPRRLPRGQGQPVARAALRRRAAPRAGPGSGRPRPRPGRASC